MTSNRIGLEPPSAQDVSDLCVAGPDLPALINLILAPGAADTIANDVRTRVATWLTQAEGLHIPPVRALHGELVWYFGGLAKSGMALSSTEVAFVVVTAVDLLARRMP